MDTRQALRSSMNISDFMVQGYLNDITAAEMFERPVPGANHIAWQFGHLILAERHLVESAVPGSMPDLPAGWADQYGRGKSPSDNRADYLPKEEYQWLAKKIRLATLQALDRLTDADFDKPVSGRVPPFVKTVGDAFAAIANHWVVHAGQWVVLRRKLGRPVMF